MSITGNWNLITGILVPSGGFIDKHNLQQYTLDGKKDGHGNLWPETSLKHLLANCIDFEEEESLLQSMGWAMGISVDRTPKRHCELAGEGIEYSWGCAKNFFQWIPIGEKRTKQGFRNMVRKCMSRDVLTTDHVKKNQNEQENTFVHIRHWGSSNNSMNKNSRQRTPFQMQQQQQRMTHLQLQSKLKSWWKCLRLTVVLWTLFRALSMQRSLNSNDRHPIDPSVNLWKMKRSFLCVHGLLLRRNYFTLKKDKIKTLILESTCCTLGIFRAKPAIYELCIKMTQYFSFVLL